MASVAGFVRNPLGYVKELGVAARLVMSPPPLAVPSEGEPRPRIRVLHDLLKWKARYQTPGDDFFRFGLHLRGVPHWYDVPPEHLSMRLRDRANGRVAVGRSFDYSALVGDKEVFLRLASAMGHPVPRLLAVLTPHEVCWVEPTRRPVRWEDVTASVPSDPLHAFCKPAVGGQGLGVFPLSIADGKVVTPDGPLDVEDLRGLVTERHLLEERLQAHPELARVHPSSVNTVRVVTVRKGGSIEPLAILFRMGIGEAAIDNVCQGGIAAIVDLDTGRVAGDAIRWTDGRRFSRHPDTGVLISGFRIPCLREAVDLTCLMHRDWGCFHSLGWDVAITPEGPVVIEANDQWGLQYFTQLDPEFGRRFMQSLPKGVWNGTA